MTPRVRRIILSHALTGFICWYGVEKVFQKTIGITPLGVSLLAIAYISVSALLNVPTGVLADKFGRRVAIVMATIALVICTLIAGLSQNIWQYLISIILWGLFYTTQNGAYEAILYDTLQEEDQTEKYARFSGISNACFWAAIFVSSVIGAWIGSRFSLRLPYFVTLVPNLLNVGLALTLHEPKRQLHEAGTTSLAIARKGLKFLVSSPQILVLTAVYLFIMLLGWTTNEFGQLYFIELGYSVLLVGLLNASSGLFQSIGNFIGHRFVGVPIRRLLIGLIILAIALFALPMSARHISVTLFMALVMVRQVSYISNNTRLQHAVPSNIRATTLSSLGMMNDGVLIASYLAFGLISQHQSVRAAFLFVIGIGVLLLATALIITRGGRMQLPRYRTAEPVFEEEVPPR